MNNETKPKEKYITMEAQIGSLKIRWNLFKVKDEDRVPNGPAYKGRGCAIWINEKPENQSTSETKPEFVDIV